MLLGHAFNRVYRERNLLSPIIGAIGVTIPDIIDKPIGSMLFDTGRWVGHTVLFITMFGMLLYRYREFWMVWIDRRISPYSLPSFAPVLLWFSMYLHLVGDLPSISAVVVLWPAFGPFPKGKRASFLLGLMDLRTQVGEVLGLVLFIVWGVRDGWRRREWAMFGAFVGIYALMLLVAVLVFGFPS